MIESRYLIGEYYYPRGHALQYFIDEKKGILVYRVIDATRPQSRAGKPVVEEGKRAIMGSPKLRRALIKETYRLIKSKYRFPNLDLVKTEIDRKSEFAKGYTEVFVTMHDLMRQAEN